MPGPLDRGLVLRALQIRGPTEDKEAMEAHLLLKQFNINFKGFPPWEKSDYN